MTVINPGGGGGAVASPLNLVTAAVNAMLANKLLAGDANPAFQINGDGTLNWGPGGAAALDTSLFRVSPGSLRVGTTLQAPSGVLTDSINNYAASLLSVTNNNGLSVSTAGAGLRVKEGANAKQGVSTLVAGTVTVANTSVTANSRILLSRSAAGGAVGHLSYTIVAGTSFTITSSSGTDTSTIVWEIFEPG